MAGKGRKCPHCERYTVSKYRGVRRCRSCKTLLWTVFQRSRAGKPRKGYECYNCQWQTVHPVGRVKGADVFRCSKCGTTYVEPVDAAIVSFKS